MVKLILSFTTGAPQAAYSADGFFGHAIEEYLIPFETTARLCNLELLAPVYTCGISYADRDADKIAQQNACPGTRVKACRSAQFRRE